MLPADARDMTVTVSNSRLRSAVQSADLQAEAVAVAREEAEAAAMSMQEELSNKLLELQQQAQQVWTVFQPLLMCKKD